MKVDEYSDKSNDTSKSDAVDKQRLVIIELEVQNDDEKNSVENVAQPVEEDQLEETPKPIIPRYVRLNHSED